MKELLNAIWKHGSRFRWVVLAFVFSGIVVTGLLIWQLSETAPVRWCTVVAMNDVPQGCFEVLLALIAVKDHAIIGLLAILGFTVLSVVAVTLKVKIDVSGPGGTSANIGSEADDVAQ